MERAPFTLIQGLKENGKTTLILCVMLALAVSLLGITLSDLYFYLHSLDVELCALRRKLEQIPSGDPVLKYTATVTLTPEQRRTDASAPLPLRDFQTENT